MLVQLAVCACVLVVVVHAGYIPPGPRYTCPVKRQALYPCVCLHGGEDGVKLLCENANLASMGVGLANFGSMNIPVDELVISNCHVGRLFGSLLHTLRVRVLRIEHTPLSSVEPHTLLGVNRSLTEIHIAGSRLLAFPSEAFQILSNVSVINITGSEIVSATGSLFANSSLPGRLERLHLANGNLLEVAPEALASLKKLKTLDLHGNKIKELRRAQFRGLRDVEVLDLSHNGMVKIDSSHLADLTKLSWLNLSHNALTDLPRGTFARNTVLRVLNLSHNKLRRLDSNSLRGMRFIRRLYFNDNEISDVGRGTFGSVTRVGTIDLARNQIKKIDYQMFHQLQFVEIIDVSENQVTVIEKLAFKDLFLVRINVSHNAIANIESGAFENCANVTVLDMSHNLIAEIPRGAFDGTTYATELLLSYNRLTSLGQVPMHNMTGMKILNVSHNMIESVPRNTFPKLYELHTIDLAENHLSEIYNAVFQPLLSLRSLNLSRNAMREIRSSTFGTLHTLNELDLSHNQLADVNKGSLARLASLRTLTLRNNSISTFFQLPISLSHLDLADNLISEIVPLTTFPSMNSLLSLNLARNRLGDSLRSGALANLLTLRTLDLSGNEMTLPPRDALGALATLQHVYMQDNMLFELPRGAFGRLPVVFELNMAGNQISSISQRAFEGLLQLLTLNLTGNNLTHIPNGAFQGLVSLRTLDLSHNRIEKLDNKTHGLLDDCLSLERVNLSHNRISFVTRKTFPSSPWIPYKLQDVDLSYNSMPVLTFDLTVGTKRVKYLNVSHNQLTEIRRGVMGNLTSLESLDLSHNEFVGFPASTFGPPPNLTHLYMSHNQLESLPLEQLEASLKFIDVRDNHLAEFDAKLMSFVENKTSVLYDGNPLNCDCRLRPLRRWLGDQLLPPAEWSSVVCSAPSHLAEQRLAELDEKLMACNQPHGETDPRYDIGPDIKFREVRRTKTGELIVTWYVSTRDDVADFLVTIRDSNVSAPVFETDVSYASRTLSVSSLPRQHGALQLCVLARNSMGETRNWRPAQCRALPPSSFSAAVTRAGVAQMLLAALLVVLIAR